jgi:SAM-dependent methyltransferase
MSPTTIERAITESTYWATQRKKEVRTLTTCLDLRGKKILNVGAGRTNLTNELLGQDSGSITNIDVENFPNLDLVASATDLPFEDNEFDIVIFLRVLHHMNDFKKALDEALRCTKPGGIILISEPYDLIVKLTRATGLDSHPQNIITKRDIEQFVKENRLTIKQKWAWIFWYYYGYQIQV